MMAISELFAAAHSLKGRGGVRTPLLAAIACTFASMVAATTPAHADEEPLNLMWTAPPGCPSSDDVRGATLRSTTTSASMNGGVLEANAQVVRSSENAWRVHLRTRRGSVTGEREIQGTTCTGVADATAVVLALALVPPGAAAPEPDPEPAPARPESSKDRPSSTNTTAYGRSSGGHLFAVGAAIAGDASSLPSFAVGGAATLAFTPGRFRFEVDGYRWRSQSRSVEGSDAGARFFMTSFGGRACWAAIRATRFDAAPCVGGDFHFIDAPGYGADANYSATGTWGTVTGGLLGRFAITSWLAARARFDAFVPLSRPTFVVENEGSVHRPPTLGISASTGVEVLFL